MTKKTEGTNRLSSTCRDLIDQQRILADFARFALLERDLSAVLQGACKGIAEGLGDPRAACEERDDLLDIESADL